MKTKNMTLEWIKLLASYMVVFIHVLFYGELGVYMDVLARFAVPLFFLVSGFFSYGISLDGIKKRIKHIVLLIVISVAAYALFEISEAMLQGNIAGVTAFFGQYLTGKAVFDLLVLNVSLASAHLWYLYAILYVYLAQYMVVRFLVNQKLIYIASAALLLLHLLLGEVFSIMGIHVPIPIVRNFALMGIPFFAAGLLAREHEEGLRRMPNSIPIVLAVVGIPASLLSRYFFGKNELYLGTLFVLFALVVLFIKCADVQYPRALHVLMNCSTYIYIFHVMLAAYILKCYGLFGIDPAQPAVTNIHPIIVCIVSTVLAIAILQISRRIHRPTAGQHKPSAE